MLKSVLFTLFISTCLVSSQTCTTSCTPYSVTLKSDPTQDKAWGSCSPVWSNAIAYTGSSVGWKTLSSSTAVYITDCITQAAPFYTQATTRYFSRIFELSCPPSAASIRCRADNSATLYINGVAVQRSLCTAATSTDNLVTPLTGYFHEGTNVIEWRVQNDALKNGSLATNPSGLIYEIIITRT